MQVLIYLWQTQEVISIWDLFKRFGHKVFLREVPYTPFCGSCGPVLLQTIDNTVVCRHCGASAR